MTYFVRAICAAAIHILVNDTSVGTATVERSFSQMKFIKTRLRSRISDVNLARLMQITIEGPELTSVDFN